MDDFLNNILLYVFIVLVYIYSLHIFETKCFSEPEI